MLLEFLCCGQGSQHINIAGLHVGIQFHQLLLDLAVTGIFFLGSDPLMPMSSHARAHRSSTQPLQSWVTVDGEEVFVQAFIGGYHIELLEISAALHAGAPAYHEVV